MKTILIIMAYITNQGWTPQYAIPYSSQEECYRHQYGGDNPHKPWAVCVPDVKGQGK